MLLTTLKLLIDRPHLGRVDVAVSVGKPDIAAHVAQVVRELKADAEVPGFRKGKAPLKRVREHFIKDVRARARARLVDSIQEAVSEQVGKQYRVLGTPKPEYDENARVDELTSFEVKLAYDIDPMSDKQLAPEGLVPQEPGCRARRIWAWADLAGRSFPRACLLVPSRLLHRAVARPHPARRHHPHRVSPAIRNRDQCATPTDRPADFEISPYTPCTTSFWRSKRMPLRYSAFEAQGPLT